MRVDRIQPQDLVKLRIKDRVLYGEVLEVADGIVRFRPLCPAAGWHRAAARQVVGHWRKVGRRSGQPDDKPTTASIATPNSYRARRPRTDPRILESVRMSLRFPPTRTPHRGSRFRVRKRHSEEDRLGHVQLVRCGRDFRHDRDGCCHCACDSPVWGVCRLLQGAITPTS